MKITRPQLRSIIKEAVDDDFFSDREANPHDGSMYGEPEGGYGADLDHETKATMVMEAVQQNLNDPDFVNWLYDELGMGS